MAVEKITSLPLMEQFYSVQGEGYYSGRPAVFIRLGGCDVGCVWCDVKESWNAQDHPFTAVTDIVNFTLASGTKLAVITGGEPAIYDLSYLADELRKHDIEVAIETSGVYLVKGVIDWVCFSPKKFKNPHDSIYEIANELKIIVYHKSDLQWAEGHRAKVNANCKLYLQPEWSKKEEMTDLILDYIKKNPSWRISLQTHKYINVP